MVKLLERMNLTAENAPSDNFTYLISGSSTKPIFDRETHQQKTVVYLTGSFKNTRGKIEEMDFVLNYGSQKALKSAGFQDTDDLEGCSLQIVRKKVTFANKKVPGLRIEKVIDPSNKEYPVTYESN